MDNLVAIDEERAPARRGLELGRAGRYPRPAFRRLGTFVFAAHLFLGVLALIMAPLVDLNAWWWLAPFCLASLLMLGLLVFRTLSRNPPSILYETGLFLAISCGVYYAFGPLLFVIGPADAAEYARLWYDVNASESVWLTGLNFVGLGLAGLAYVYTRLPSLAKISLATARGWGEVPPPRVFVAFLLIGLAAKYLFVLPFEFRLTNAVPSGTVRQLARLLTVALLIGWIYRDRGPRWLGRTAMLLLFEEVATGFLMFNKTEVLIAVVAAALGNYFAHGQLRKLVIAAVVGSMVYVSINPLVTFGRNELTYRSGGVRAPADLAERLEIAESYFTGTESHRRQRDTSGLWWSRLNYLPPQQAVIEFYDQGRGSSDLERLFWIFVPRLVFPGKPDLSGTGVELTERVTGYRHSSTGVGIFADGYYLLGWLGVLVASITYGIALRAYSVISRSVVQSRAAAMYPLVFLGIYVGLRADGWWLIDVAGPMVFTLGGLGLLRLFAKW